MTINATKDQLETEAIELCLRLADERLTEHFRRDKNRLFIGDRKRMGRLNYLWHIAARRWRRRTRRRTHL